MSLVPGYLGTITINAQDFGDIAGNVLSLNLAKNVMVKPIFGNSFSNALGGQRTGTFSASGHVEAAEIENVVAAFESDDAVAVSIQVGTASESTDGGVYTGDAVVGSFTINTSADGEWEWSIDGTFDGAVDYAEPTSA